MAVSNKHRAIVGGADKALPFRDSVFVADVDKSIGFVEIENTDVPHRRLKHNV